MKTWIGRSAPLGNRTRRPASTLSVIGAEISHDGSAGEYLLQALERVVQRVRVDRLPPDRSGAGHRSPVSHHVDASLGTMDLAWPADFDPSLITPPRAERTQR